MIEQISLQRARERTWDVIVAGSSFASMFFVAGLPRQLSVLFIEKGRLQSHDDQLSNGLQGREKISQQNDSPFDKRWVAHTTFGGNSNCWWAQTPRLHPNDFRLHSAYGVGTDWPLTYDDLEPSYVDVESMMEVAGGGADHLLPRSRPFPYPPHAPSRSDKVLRAHDGHWIAAPTARSHGGARPVCCANGVCTLCPIDSKFTILNSIDQFDRPGLAMVLGADVRAVTIANQTATGVVVSHPEGQSELDSTLVALGTNAVFNAAILLRSGLQSPALGRYLHEQTSRAVLLDVPIPNYFGGTSITGHNYAFYDGPHRSEAAAVLIENFNAPPSIRLERGHWTDRLWLNLIAEDLPQADNRVVLENDEPKILWRGHAAYGRAGVDRVVARLAEILPFDIEAMALQDYKPSDAHIQGTTRMGDNKDTSVVDGGLKTHAVRNLLALGAGAFPACSPANPTLTLSALSLRAARLL